MSSEGSEILSFSILHVPSAITRKTELRKTQTKIQLLRVKKRKILILFCNGNSLPGQIKVICKTTFRFKKL